MTTISEMIEVVQMYMRHRKGVEVQIKLRDLRDVSILIDIYQPAIEWLNNNGFKVLQK